MISSLQKSSMVAKGQIKKWIQLLIAIGLMAIETGTDKNAIGRVKHHKAVLPEQIMAQLSIKM